MIEAVRPYVDRRVTDVSAADRVAADVAREAGLPPPDRLRVGMNAIYVCDEVVLRVGHTSAPAAAAHRLVNVVIAHGIPTIAPIDGLAVDRHDFAVTGWQRARASRRPVAWEAVGRAVAAVHALPVDQIPADYPMPPPAAFPWWDFDALLAEVADRVDEPALAGLRDALARNDGWRTMLEAEQVVCHGDVHPGNVLMTDAGPMLIDWDLLSWAPPAWDHAMLTTYAGRWGGDAGAYDAFADGYGRSLADDLTTQAVAELRNVAATLMRVRAGITDPAAQAEASRRLRYWRGDRDAPVWRAQ